ncbi:hypothetical protein B0H19DRAFT_468083 [Mycena capillaripes]|nr:hypothetical protein B0H19DRAFT_468083 [Mycena capillaripes]
MSLRVFVFGDIPSPNDRLSILMAPSSLLPVTIVHWRPLLPLVSIPLSPTARQAFSSYCIPIPRRRLRRLRIVLPGISRSSQTEPHSLSHTTTACDPTAPARRLANLCTRNPDPNYSVPSPFPIALLHTTCMGGALTTPSLCIPVLCCPPPFPFPTSPAYLITTESVLLTRIGIGPHRTYIRPDPGRALDQTPPRNPNLGFLLYFVFPAFFP